MFPELAENRSMIFNPLIVVASELGLPRPSARARSNEERTSSLIQAYRCAASSELGSLIVDGVDDESTAAVAAEGAYTVRTDLGAVDRTHNYRSNSGAERIAATVNRFDRFYSHDIVIAVADDVSELKPLYLQALMYALATTEVGIATLVTPLRNGSLPDDEGPKASVKWNPDRIVYPLEGSRVGTVMDIRRDKNLLQGEDCYELVPIYAWRRAALDRVVRTPPSEREFVEGTDLVRALEMGIRIDAALVTEDMKVLMTPEQLRGEIVDMGH
jgi:3-deoxy-manno-octulosonate cytidylyltransferase (CMP-KDO synthetase)